MSLQPSPFYYWGNISDDKSLKMAPNGPKLHRIHKYTTNKSETGHVRVAVTDSSTNGTWIISEHEQERKPLQKGIQTTLKDGDIIVLPQGIGFRFLVLPSTRLVKCHIPWGEKEIKRENGENCNESLYSTRCMNFQGETKTAFLDRQSSKCGLKRKTQTILDYTHSCEKRMCKNSGNVLPENKSDSAMEELDKTSSEYSSLSDIRVHRAGNVSKMEDNLQKVLEQAQKTPVNNRILIDLTTESECSLVEECKESVKNYVVGGMSCSVVGAGASLSKNIHVQSSRELGPNVGAAHSFCDVEPVSELERSQSSLETNECCYCGQMIPVLTHGLHEAVCEGNSQASNRDELENTAARSQGSSEGSDEDKVSFRSDGIGNKITIHCDDDRSTDEDGIQSREVSVSKNMACKPEHHVPVSHSVGNEDGAVNALDKGVMPSHDLYYGHNKPGSSVLLGKEESVERCTFCSENFPVSELVTHAQICSDVNTKCIVESEPKLPDSDEYELCPHCNEEFPLTQLIPHVQVCTNNPESTHSARENPQFSFGESSLEQCPHCREEFLITLLVDHAQVCTKNPKRKRVEDIDEKSLREHPMISSSSCYYEVSSSMSDSDSQSSSQQDLKCTCPHCLREFPISFVFDHVDSCKGKTSKEESKECGTKLEKVGFVESDDKAKRESSQDVLTDCPLCGIEVPVSVINKHFIMCDTKHSNSLDDLDYSSTDMTEKTFPAEECVENLRNRVSEVKASNDTAKFDSHFDSSVEPGQSKEHRTTGSGSDDGEEVVVNITLSTGNDLVGAAEERESSVETALLLRKESSLSSYQDCHEQCCYCLKMFPICKLVQHASSCMEQSRTEDQDVEQCCYCLELFPLSDLVFHALKCNQKSVDKCGEEVNVSSQSSSGSEPMERCMYCFRDFPVCTLITHAQTCDGDISGPRERFKGFLPSAHDLSAVSSLAVLSDVQQNALDYVIKCSARDSRRAAVELLTRVRTLGYRKEDLQRTLHWVRGAVPIIIHVNLDTCLHFLVSDTHYRNRFETGTSGGSMDKSARMSWESSIFNGIYDSSRPEDRVKYGVLNIVGDPHGVRSCLTYGDSFLQLKKVRLRTTFASMDSSGAGVKLSCCEHYGSVLYEYTDSELKAIMDVATGKVPFCPSDCISQYKEVQIHGPVCLSENIECVVVNSRHHGDKRINRLLDKFVEYTKCNLIWMDPDGPNLSGSYY